MMLKQESKVGRKPDWKNGLYLMLHCIPQIIPLHFIYLRLIAASNDEKSGSRRL
jgi:hypothetical protein